MLVLNAGLVVQQGQCLHWAACLHGHVWFGGPAVRLAAMSAALVPLPTSVCRTLHPPRLQGFDLKFLNIGGGLGIDYQKK